ncbi:autocrine proliferation repressor protein A-like isoform X3 [Apostichopus japonicus]
MSITIPNEIKYEDTALVFITGGSNLDSPPTIMKQEVAWTMQMSSQLGMVVATLFQVPNQPIRFPNDKRDFDRYEDDIIAFCWRRFITEAPEDPYFLLRMPMTKATVQAMDTISNVVNSKISRFYLTGASKRGWTAWSTAAVDDRVVGIAPQVLDLLNFEDNLQHHFRSLKGWTFALEPYWSENTTSLYGHPNFPLLVQVSDPFSYRDILTMPKYIITASNDEFFLPDDSHYFYDQMNGPTFLRIHPNVGHNLTPRATFLLSELIAFITSVEEDWTFPTLTWTRKENATHGEIRMVVEQQTPTKVTAYRAHTNNESNRRDFRLHFFDYTTGNIAMSSVVYEEFEVAEEMNAFVAVTEKPTTGWTCFFIEVEFAAVGGQPIRFTSEVNIIPDVFPIGPCEGEGCYGSIV